MSTRIVQQTGYLEINYSQNRDLNDHEKNINWLKDNQKATYTPE